MKRAKPLEERLQEVRELLERRGLPHGLGEPPPQERHPPKGVVVRESVFPSDYRHGEVLLGDLHGYPERVYRVLGGGRGTGTFRPGVAVFLDTETTGLAGGAGTYAFLVGLGRFEERGFVVRQFLMTDLSEEREMLRRLDEDLQPLSSVVTFNGASFDLPLLRTRCVMQGLRQDWSWEHHLDLLPLSRRLWRGRFESCRLSCLEEGVFDFKRRGDIPGYAIPDLYVRFLRERRLSLLEPVLEHNVWDIVSLAALTARVCGLLEAGEGGVLEEGWDFAAAGGAFAAAAEADLSLSCLTAALEHELPEEKRRSVARTVGMLLKAGNRRQEAVAIWDLLRREFPDEYPSRIELAKHYEHKEKDLEAALEAAREALRLARGAGGGRRSEARERECERRVGRLRRKMGKGGE